MKPKRVAKDSISVLCTCHFSWQTTSALLMLLHHSITQTALYPWMKSQELQFVIHMEIHAAELRLLVTPGKGCSICEVIYRCLGEHVEQLELSEWSWVQRM